MPHTSLPEETPRAVTRSGLHILKVICLSIVFIVTWAITCGIIYPSLIIEKGLIDHGVEATGEIVKWHTENAKNGIRYRVSYEYTVDDKTFINDDKISEPYFEYRKQGASLPILYDKFHPNISAQNADDYVRGGKVFPSSKMTLEVLSIFILAVYALSLRVTTGSYRKEKTLLMWGVKSDARIISETEYETRSGKFSEFTYEFSVPGQGTYSGTRNDVPTKSSPLASTRAALIDNPVVLYQPGNPKNNALYPLSEVKLRQ